MFSSSKKSLLFLFIFLVFFSFLLFGSQTKAQTTSVALVESRRAELESELAELELEIKLKQATLDSQKEKSTSLSRDVDILKTKIGKAKLDIKKQNLIIEKLSKEINQKVEIIGTLSDRVERQKKSLAELIRQTNEIDQNTAIHLILSSENLFDFYSDFDSFGFLNESLKDSIDEIKIVKKNTEVEKDQLKKKQDQEVDAKVKIETIKRQTEKNQTEQKKLLSLSKDKEKEYQNIVAERLKQAAQIRSALFVLRDTAAIPFGQALEYANLAYQKTGVRPAFLLAILTQESNLGQNVGTCNRAGDPPEKSWANIMKPSRDHAPYLNLMASLGLDPNSMPLSCPWGNGWGGAMGPAQFIPSTWDAYKNKIANALGISVANPWDPKHAFMASAIYLAELGADAGTYSSERTAALKYYAGGNWNKSSNAFYGNQVMAKATDIEENMIDPLQGV